MIIALHKACPLKITRLLTDNGKEFTDRLFTSRARQPSGNHEFDQLCQALGIEHRLTQPRTLRTNRIVERFNGRIADVLKTHRFDSTQDLEQTLLRYTYGAMSRHLRRHVVRAQPVQEMRLFNAWADPPRLAHLLRTQRSAMAALAEMLWTLQMEPQAPTRRWPYRNPWCSGADPFHGRLAPA